MASVAAAVVNVAGVNPALDGDRRRPPATATGHHPPDLRLPPFPPGPAQTPIPAVFGCNRVACKPRTAPETDSDGKARALFAMKRAQGKPASAPDTCPSPSAHPNPAQVQPARRRCPGERS